MMKRNWIQAGSYVLVAALASFVTLAASTFWGNPGTGKLEQLLTLIDEKYIGESDQTTLQDAAAAAMVAATGDRWSYYIPAQGYQSYQERSENVYVGVGITIQEAPEGAGFLVLKVEENGPAFEAGVEPKDLIIAVDGQDVREMSLEDVKNLVMGEEGSFVQLTVLRQGDHRGLTVQRRKVQNQVTYWELITEDVGLVTIGNFNERCAEETIAAIEALLEQGAQKLIFDVRHNGGGYADEMVKVLDYLLPEGELFRMVSYRGKETVNRSDAACLELPMAVLVNQSSYSAAEFFAAALQEYEAAVILGEHTSGKGFYQNTFRLQDGSAVALSVGRYYTPQGNCLEGIGIDPDILVEVDSETAAAIYYGTLEPLDDPYIQKALEALK